MLSCLQIVPRRQPGPEVALDGTVERITFYNPTNGFSVVRLRVRGRRDPITVVGTLPAAQPGELLAMHGRWQTDPRHGAQFRPTTAEVRRPSDVDGIVRYLGSGLVRQIGPVLAKRIVGTFGERTLEVLDATPERVREVPGIGPQRARGIAAAWAEHRALRDVMAFLAEHGLDTRFAPRLLAAYGDGCAAHPERQSVPAGGGRARVWVPIGGSARQGSGRPPHRPGPRAGGRSRRRCWRPARTATPACCTRRWWKRRPPSRRCRRSWPRAAWRNCWPAGRSRCGAAPESAQRTHQRPSHGRRRGARSRHSPRPLPAPEREPGGEVRGRVRIYTPADLSPRPRPRRPLTSAGLGIGLAGLVRAEEDLASRLLGLARRPGLPARRVERWLAADAESRGLSEEQRQAVATAATSGCFVLTGGPGVGKTTTTRALVRCLQALGRSVALAAPTGKAARRLGEVVGLEARTLHRLLGAGPGGFRYNADDPLPFDVLIVDEASMLDTQLARAVVRAVGPGSQLILVGDADQLPSVGPGQVLRDVLASGRVPSARLETVFRQAALSQIVTNAHRIRQGLLPELAPPAALAADSVGGSDCVFVRGAARTRRRRGRRVGRRPAAAPARRARPARSRRSRRWSASARR